MKPEDDKAHFDETANNPKLWVMRAGDLHLAAAVLRERVVSVPCEPKNDLAGAFEALRYSGLICQAAMLQGFAIEAYLKAFCLVSGDTLAQDGEYALPNLKRDVHDLPRIAEAVGFPLTDSEKEVMGRLSLFVSSYGRYPITKKWHQNPMTTTKEGIPCRQRWDNDDHALTEALIERLQVATKT